MKINFISLFKQRHLKELILSLAVSSASIACTNTSVQDGDYAQDVAFMKKHTDLVLLESGNSSVAVAPAYQGRVMTSTFDQGQGPSFGWINRPVIEKGFLSDEERKGKLEDHIYIFGGEERFWLGPEGGQYALFFKPGKTFTFSDWTTPAAIDTEAYQIVEKSKDSVKFSHNCDLLNHSGTQFKVGIERTVKILDKTQVAKVLKVAIAEEVRLVAYETDNRITNRGNKAWNKKTGLLSIWILGMYKPSPKTTVVIPFKDGKNSELGPKVNDSYFGKITDDYLQVEEDLIFFRGDGTKRGKIGLSAQRSKGIAGSYDASGKVLTIVTYNIQDAPNGYVNSMWEHQKQPYAGDVINSYNDGSPGPGLAPLGPFYELETSSPAAALKPGQSMKHIQQTIHFQGSEKALEPISRALLGVGLKTIKAKF